MSPSPVTVKETAAQRGKRTHPKSPPTPGARFTPRCEPHLYTAWSGADREATWSSSLHPSGREDAKTQPTGVRMGQVILRALFLRVHIEEAIWGSQSPRSQWGPRQPFLTPGPTGEPSLVCWSLSRLEAPCTGSWSSSSVSDPSTHYSPWNTVGAL